MEKDLYEPLIRKAFSDRGLEFPENDTVIKNIPFPIIKDGKWNNDWFNMDFIKNSLPLPEIERLKLRYINHEGLNKINIISTVCLMCGIDVFS